MQKLKNTLNPTQWPGKGQKGACVTIASVVIQVYTLLLIGVQIFFWRGKVIITSYLLKQCFYKKLRQK